MEFGRDKPLVWPGENSSVGRGSLVTVVLTGHVEGEIDKGLSAGCDKGGEPIIKLTPATLSTRW